MCVRAKMCVDVRLCALERENEREGEVFGSHESVELRTLKREKQQRRTTKRGEGWGEQGRANRDKGGSNRSSKKTDKGEGRRKKREGEGEGERVREMSLSRCRTT